MKLTEAEVDCIQQTLNKHGIKYQEVYDELKDHLMAVVEQARIDGDTRNVQDVLNDSISTQFSRWSPFEEIVKQYEVAYRQKISRAVWGTFRSYFNWKTIPLMVLVLIASFYLPQNKLTSALMIIILALISMYPVIYIFAKTSRIKTDNGRHSLTKGYLLGTANLTVAGFNIINVLGGAGRNIKSVSFLNPMHYPPLIFMILFTICLVYGLSCVKISKQEFNNSIG